MRAGNNYEELEWKNKKVEEFRVNKIRIYKKLGWKITQQGYFPKQKYQNQNISEGAYI